MALKQLKELTLDELEAQIDNVADQLAADTLNGTLYHKLAMLLQHHTDRINGVVYRGEKPTYSA